MTPGGVGLASIIPPQRVSADRGGGPPIALATGGGGGYRQTSNAKPDTNVNRSCHPERSKICHKPQALTVLRSEGPRSLKLLRQQTFLFFLYAKPGSFRLRSG